MANKQITLNEFIERLNFLIGLSVSRAWLGYGSPIFLELGNLTAESPRNYERGEFLININWDWRIECETKILFGSSNDRKEIQNGLDDIKNAKVKSVDVSGAIPEISVTFENGYVLRSMSMHSGNPQWNIGFNDSDFMFWENGYFFFGAGEEELLSADIERMNRAEATVKRWNLPSIDKSENNCRRCEHYYGIEGNYELLDYGVCTSDLSEFDGRVIKSGFGCMFFTPIKQ